VTVLQAVLLGLVQGFTEFIPVSSSGHLVLIGRFFGVREGSLTLSALLHLGTLLPVLVVFRNDIIALIKKPFQKATGLLVVGTLPAVAAALIFGDAIENLFADGSLLGLGFIVTGALLFYADFASGGKKKESEMTYADACVVGLLQAAAIAPGVSRSGAVVTGSLGRGMDRAAAARFSFMLSIPAIAGGAVFALKDVFTGSGEAALPAGPAALAAGFVAAAVSGYFAVRLMLNVIQKSKLKYFSYYLFALGVFLTAERFIFSF